MNDLYDTVCRSCENYGCCVWCGHGIDQVTTRCDAMRVGDIFVDRGQLRPWRITGWLKNDGQNPHTISLDGREEKSLFAGCATPFGPFPTAEEAIAFSQRFGRVAPRRAV